MYYRHMLYAYTVMLAFPLYINTLCPRVSYNSEYARRAAWGDQRFSELGHDVMPNVCNECR